MEHLKKIFYLIILVTLLFFKDSFLLAQTEEEYINQLTQGTPIIERADLIKITFTAIQYFLNFLGVITILVILYGGFMWMTAGGNEEKVLRAKRILIEGIIGFVIILLAYMITIFVVSRVYKFAK